MKINLYINNVTNTIPGYNDIEISTDVALNDIPPGSCDEILCRNSLEYVDWKQILPLIISKMAYGSQLIIQGIDLIEVCRDIVFQQTSVADEYEILYGKGRRLITLESLLQFFASTPLKVMQKRIASPEYILVVKRPEN